MKRTLFLAVALGMLPAGTQAAVTYTQDVFATAFTDEVNNVVYNGNGYFAVQSGISTKVELTINLTDLYNYVQNHDYLESYMIEWDCNEYNYGLADTRTADTNSTTTYTPTITGWVSPNKWTSKGSIDYNVLQNYTDASNNITFTITNNNSGSSPKGVKVTAINSLTGTSEQLYYADSLYFGSNTSVSGYSINLNYVKAITLHTESTLDTSTYEPPKDYTLPFASSRTDGTSIKRTMFLGDSITHGYGNQSHRWQFFKILEDNGIEHEIVGPRAGYHSKQSDLDDRDKASNSYGGVEFSNTHLAQSSGRTYNIISGASSTTIDGKLYSSNPNYGGHSTESSAQKYDCDTWICLMGTNDILSDVDTNAPASDYTETIQYLLGGTVTYDATAGTWSWDANSSRETEIPLGTMGTIAGDVLKDDTDTFYMLSIPTWSTKNSKHGNDALCREATQQYNGLLKQWVNHWNTDTSDATKGTMVYVESNRGLVDVTKGKFEGPAAFFNASDGLHPTEQGALIIAGNLAQAMGIGGRTAGLERQSAEGWNSVAIGTISANSSALYAQNAFSMVGGYSIDFDAVFGNGATDGWLAANNALSISLGDGMYSGTLNVSEGYISWGNNVLFCLDNSALAEAGNLRITWHNGNEQDNVLKGYYVWLGDMLIGQGLTASENQKLNGISVSATGADGAIQHLAWVNTAYAPTTTLTSSAEHAYITSQTASSGVNFGTLTETDKSTAYVYQNANDPTLINIVSKLNNENKGGWVGLFNSSVTNKPNVSAQITGNIASTVFGSMGGHAGTLLVQVDGGTIAGGVFNEKTAAIAGAYGSGKADAFRVFVNSGIVNGDIVGGSINGNSSSIGTVEIVVNNGNINGNIYAGSKVNATVGSANITINGGTITGDIVAGGTSGSLGNTQITINGGIIKGNISKGAAAAVKSEVTVVGNQAAISGNITADAVTLKNVKASQNTQEFAHYTGTITADKLTLSNVHYDIAAQLNGISSLEVINGSMTSVALGDAITLTNLVLGNNTTLGVYKTGDARSANTTHETTITAGTLTVGTGATLNANLVLTESSILNMQGCLAMGSEVALASTTQINMTGAMAEQLRKGVEVQLFSGIDKLLLDGQEVTDNTITMANISIDGEAAAPFEMTFNNGVLSLSIPEPTTATLSLLALSALVTRRRRRG